MSGGANFVNDLQHNANPRDAFNARARETLHQLKRKAMYGEGFNSGRFPKKRQLSATSVKVKAKKRKTVKKKKTNKKKKTPVKGKKKTVKKKRTIKDIFSN